MEMPPVGDAEPDEPAMGVDPPGGADAVGADDADPAGAEPLGLMVVVVSEGWGPPAGAEDADGAGTRELGSSGLGAGAGAGEPPAAAPHSPVIESPSPVPVTSGPGSGKAATFVSATLQVFVPMFATNIAGRLENGTPGEPPLPFWMSTAKQFMYISRLPTLLNQVHAPSAVPVGASDGTVKDTADIGQLPIQL